ncbi:MAG: hypothetical protein QMD65_00040 [Patescibacteria group bacterium]|nr:hypothetical protein [Patescibacteria group bacterium]
MKIVGILFTVLVLSVFTGCVTTEKEYSPVLREKGEIVDLIYVPSRHGSGLSPSIDMDGKLGLQLTSISVAEKYVVIFRCEKHGTIFIIEKNQRKTKRLWERFKKGQQVTISYREVYETRRDGEKLERKLVDLDFLDAE